MFDWLGKGSSVDRLVARRQYTRAAEAIRRELKESPRSVHLRQRLADVLLLDGEKEKAVAILHRLVDDFAEAGFLAKSIAVAKKIERVDPDNVVVGEQLAALIREREREEQSAATFKSAQLRPRGAIAEAAAATEAAAPLIEVEAVEGEVAAFQGSPLFQGMSSDEMLALVNGLELRTFEPGEVIVTEGEAGASMFLVASGVVRVYVRSQDGANVPLRAHEQGDFFGEVSLLTASPRTATVTAASSCELLELSREDLRAIAAEQPQVPSIIEAFCTRRLGSIEESEARSGG